MLPAEPKECDRLHPNTCSPVSRRFQEIEARGKRWVESAMAALKGLNDADRALLPAWLCVYYDDEGGLFSPQLNKMRRRITLDGVDY
jgi:hypothetical protein